MNLFGYMCVCYGQKNFDICKNSILEKFDHTYKKYMHFDHTYKNTYMQFDRTYKKYLHAFIIF